MNASSWLALAAGALTTLSLILRRARQPVARTIPSPRETLLPIISLEQAAALPYPPNLLPGARDVTTPYGTMRVYEWGPEDGDKVLFIHGDSTPAPVLGPIAHILVRKGCRVMMFDLWGRGYSDTPFDVPHDARLYGMQIHFATASSSLPWSGAGSGGFSIVAFSLGGGIAMAFAADFCYLINSIILLAPAGIIRRLPAEYENMLFRYSSLLPSSYLRILVGRLLGVKVSGSNADHSGLRDQIQIAAEKAENLKTVGSKVLDIQGILQWQYDTHRGLVHSFISTIQYGPMQHQHSVWRRVCSIIKGDTARTPLSSHHCPLFNSKMLVILGEADNVVLAEEVSADLCYMMGDSGHVEFKTVPGGHGFPVPDCDEVAKHISDFCGFESGDRTGA